MARNRESMNFYNWQIFASQLQKSAGYVAFFLPVIKKHDMV